MQNGEEFMLNCSDVKKTYFNKTAVENISLSLENGRIYALLGPNGSGKTTFMKMIAGLVKPTSGTILYENEPIGVPPCLKKPRPFVRTCAGSITILYHQTVE